VCSSDLAGLGEGRKFLPVGNNGKRDKTRQDKVRLCYNRHTGKQSISIDPVF
jgi:hypothetical protein